MTKGDNMAWQDILKESLGEKYLRLERKMKQDARSRAFLRKIEESRADYRDVENYYKYAISEIESYLAGKGTSYSQLQTGSKDPFNPKLLEYDPKRKTEGKRKYYTNR